MGTTSCPREGVFCYSCPLEGVECFPFQAAAREAGEAVLNVTTGEYVDVEMSLGMPRSERRRMLRDFCKQMNDEHRAGTAHVRDFHDGEAQRYRVVKV